MLVLLGACSSPAPPATAPAPSPPLAPTAKVDAGDPAMTQLLDLVAFLSRDVSVEDVTARLGPISSDHGPPVVAELAPRDPSFVAVTLGRDPDDGKPSTVHLELARAVPVAELVAAFGAFQQGRTDRGRPRELLFPPAGPGPWKIVLIARLPPGSSPLAEGEASEVTLRRDPP
jgi:hypothetical protein